MPVTISNMSKKSRGVKPSNTPCPCGSGQPYATCCGTCHSGTPAATAEALMRSRYSAYALGLEDYLLATWHITTRPSQLDLNAETPAPQWIALQVLRHTPIDDNHAIVEFIARCRIGGRAQRLHEISHFVREDGRWYYLKAENEPD